MWKYLKHPLRFFDGIFDRVFAVLGAVALSQFPQFYGQYMQRLGGHLDEARRTLDQYIKAAEALNLTLAEYIHEHLDSGREIFISSGEVMEGLLERLNALEKSYLALQDAGMLNRWFVFLREVDWSIAANTWRNFVPGIPTTLEGLIYAFTGLLLGWGLYTLLKTLLHLPVRAIGEMRHQARQKAEQEELQQKTMQSPPI